MTALPVASLAFPYYIPVLGMRVHPHLFFELLAYSIGFQLYLWLRRRRGDVIPLMDRWVMVASATAGAALGAKLMAWLEDPATTWQLLHDPVANAGLLLGGKSIVGALAGGLVVVELVKLATGVRQSTGDLYAIPLAVGIAVGRVGCFLTGLADNTCGTATTLPWGVDFGDSVRRHPTQIYEIVFLLVLVPVLKQVMRRLPTPGAEESGARWRSGDAFKFFMVSYLGWRLLVDFLKPYPAVALGLGGIQWVCVAVLAYYLRDMLRWVRGGRATEGVSEAAPAKEDPRE